MSGKQPIYHRHLDTPPGEYDDDARVPEDVLARLPQPDPPGGFQRSASAQGWASALERDLTFDLRDARQALSDRDARIKHLDAIARDLCHAIERGCEQIRNVRSYGLPGSAASAAHAILSKACIDALAADALSRPTVPANEH